MRIAWLTQGSFLFAADGCRLVVDPYMSDCLAAKGSPRMVPFPLGVGDLRPDAVIATHDHLDHLDPETVGAIAAAHPGCLFAGPERVFDHLGRLGIARRTLLAAGETARFGPFVVEPVFARHSDPTAVGLVVAEGGTRVYLTGDTEYDGRLVSPATRGCDLLLVCINGRLGNMTRDEALSLVREIRPRAAAPMHYGLFASNTADPAPFVAGCRAMGIASRAMEPGKEFEP